MAIIGDKFWLWGHEADSHDGYVGKSSRMTPAEGAFYLNIPNMWLVQYHGKPKPPFDQYAVPLRPLKQVVWSIVGAGGEIETAVQQAVLDLAGRMKNITGVIMDDFFRKDRQGSTDIAALSIDQIKEVKRRIKTVGRKLDLWVVLYDWAVVLGPEFCRPIQEYLELCDKVTFWTWCAKGLANMEKNFAAAEKLAPKAGKLLGCYMYDYGPQKEMPVDLMKMQCETGLRWLKQGRIEGMVFLASCICDMELKAVEWTRNWIAEVGTQSV